MSLLLSTRCSLTSTGNEDDKIGSLLNSVQETESHVCMKHSKNVAFEDEPRMDEWIIFVSNILRIPVKRLIITTNQSLQKSEVLISICKFLDTTF